MSERALVDAYRQGGAGVRFDWGPSGADALGGDDGAIVIVDTLSFTTSVSVATGRGIGIIPYPLEESGAAALAAAHGAALAVPRAELSPEHPWSLSPASLLAAPHTARLVLPSPNGSAIASARAEAGQLVLAGCLRNPSATSSWLTDHGYGTAQRPVSVIAAGERWPDGSLRPALEDYLGAGVLIGRLRDAGCVLSSEAGVAAASFDATADLAATLRACASARELAMRGFPDEVEIAAALDADAHASVLRGAVFVRS